MRALRGDFEAIPRSTVPSPLGEKDRMRGSFAAAKVKQSSGLTIKGPLSSFALKNGMRAPKLGEVWAFSLKFVYDVVKRRVMNMSGGAFLSPWEDRQCEGVWN